MNFFKRLIPKDHVTPVTELESWTVRWQFKTGWSNDVKVMHKVLIKEADAVEYEKQLHECANFIGCWIHTEKFKN